MRKVVTSVFTILASVLMALPCMSADIIWTGGATNVWIEGATSTWDSGKHPTATDSALFKTPYDVPMLITINEPVVAYGVKAHNNRTAPLTLTGSGAIMNYRSALIELSPCHVFWDVDVTNLYTGSWLYLRGTNTFYKCLYVGADKSLQVEKSATAVDFVGTASMTAYDIRVKEGASLTIGENVKFNVNCLNADPDTRLVTTGNPEITFVTTVRPPFSRDEGVTEEWILGGGLFNGIGTDSRLEFGACTNAVKTVSGSGTFLLNRVYTTYSTNLFVRFNGPNVYTKTAPSGTDVTLQFSNGSIFGAVGGNMSLSSTVVYDVLGAATIDTNDPRNGTPRNVSVSKIGDCNGVLSIVGDGKFSLSVSLVSKPNLGMIVKDTAYMEFPSGVSVYEIGDVVLQDQAKMTTQNYLGRSGTGFVKSLTMSGSSTLDVSRYVRASGNVNLSGRASAVVHNSNSDKNPTFESANLSLSDDASLVVTGNLATTSISLSDDASLVVTGTIAAASLAMSGNAHLAFTAGTAFTAGSNFGAGDWSMEITIPSDYEAGLRPIVKGAKFDESFTNRVTIVGETTDWELRVIDGIPVLYKPTDPQGVEWIGGGSDNKWSTNANWNEGRTPTSEDVVAFGGLKRPEPFDDDFISTVSGLVFRASAGPFCITGSVDQLSFTADCKGRGDANEYNAAIVSHSGFDQTFAVPVNFGDNNSYILADGGGDIEFAKGVVASNDWRYFVVTGNVKLRDKSSIALLSFKNSGPITKSSLTLLSGSELIIRQQGIRSFSDEVNYPGYIVIEEGAVMLVQDGVCGFFNPARESVIDGTLIVGGANKSAHLFAERNEQYYVGSGEIYADNAKSGRNSASASHYVNFGGTLKLYMNGDWLTATFATDPNSATTVTQNPNYPTRFRMTDGTTLGATADWKHGPMEGTYAEANTYTTTNGMDVITEDVTPAERVSVMTGTVTVNTQNPTNDAAHTITFVDPLDASEATVVKEGKGTLAFAEPEGYQSRFRDLTVNEGVVSFTTAPTLTGTLTVAADAKVILSGDMSAWREVARASAIVGPDGATEWSSGRVGKMEYRVVEDGDVKILLGMKAGGSIMILR